MNLLEKKVELISVHEPLSSLTGTKVSVEIDGKVIEGNFRNFKTNGQANIYLDSSCLNKKGNSTRWIKTSPAKVELV